MMRFCFVHKFDTWWIIQSDQSIKSAHEFDYATEQ